MSAIVAVDLLNVAQKLHPGLPVTFHGADPIQITGNVNLWRFNLEEEDDDALHILTDGAGGALAITHPGTTREASRGIDLRDYV